MQLCCVCGGRAWPRTWRRAAAGQPHGTVWCTLFCAAPPHAPRAALARAWPRVHAPPPQGDEFLCNASPFPLARPTPPHAPLPFPAAPTRTWPRTPPPTTARPRSSTTPSRRSWWRRGTRWTCLPARWTRWVWNARGGWSGVGQAPVAAWLGGSCCCMAGWQRALQDSLLAVGSCLKPASASPLPLPCTGGPLGNEGLHRAHRRLRGTGVHAPGWGVRESSQGLLAAGSVARCWDCCFKRSAASPPPPPPPHLPVPPNQPTTRPPTRPSASPTPCPAPQTDTFTNPIFKDSMRRMFTPAGEEGHLGLSSNATFEVGGGNACTACDALPVAGRHAHPPMHTRPTCK